MKKSCIAHGVVLIVLFACVASACTKDKPAEKTANENLTASGQFPIVKEKETLKVLVVPNESVENIATNDFTKWYEEKTNVHIEWEIVPNNSKKEKLNLVLASGDLPDVIFGFEVPYEQQIIYGEQGTFLPLNDLIEKYGVETKKVFQQKPFLRNLNTAPNGKIYSLPGFPECYHCTAGNKVWIYQPWLNKLGLNMPSTTEEFYNVLKAFKEKDPNGNGKADEIPMAGSISQYNNSVVNYIMSAFVADNGQNRLMVENGKIVPIFNKPQFKEGLTYINRLFKEGLITKESFTQDTNQLKKLVGNSSAPLVGVVPVSGANSVLDVNSERYPEYVAVPPLKGPSGYQKTANLAYDSNKTGRFLITSASKHPDVAFRWADALYDREITMRTRFGTMDKDWKWLENKGEIGVNGLPAQWVNMNPSVPLQNMSWSHTGVYFTPKELLLSVVKDKAAIHEEMMFKATKNLYEPYHQDLKEVVPPLFFNKKQSEEMTDLSKTINDYVVQMIARFAIGDANIEKEWDNYLKTLNNMNLKRYLEIYQEAFDVSKMK